MALLLVAAGARADNLAVDVGSSITITVAADGSQPFTYQWRKDGVAIPGATGSSYSIASATAQNAGVYTAVVSNPLGSTISDNATLTVNAKIVAPAITQQPVALTVTEGNAANFTVTASGTTPSYQWLKNGVAISGATSSTYTIATTMLSSAGNYSVVVSNSAGTVTSLSAGLTVKSSLGLEELTPTTYSARGASNSAVGVAKLFDGQSGTAWLDKSASTWVLLTFAEPTALEAYSLTSAKDSPGCDPASWTLSGSKDGVTWTVIDVRTNQSWATRGLVRDFVLATRSAAYTQFRFDFKVASGSFTQLAEMELYGSSGVPVELTPASYAARGASNSAVGVAKLFDGLSGTAWLDKSASTWVLLTFAEPTVLEAYSLTSAKDSPGCDPASWTLSGSKDGVTWTVIEVRTNQSWPTRELARDFVLATRSAAYTQFRFDFKVASGSLTQLAEMQLFGQP